MLPYNDRAAVEKVFAEHGDRIACLITEAAPGNMGVIPPEPGFNAFLAETCARHGALFVSDEVMTGFRASARGQWGLDGAVEGWQPDLVTFGKVIGGGFPAAAFGGRADVMSRLAPEGPVYQAGTLSGNPVATTAGLTTLRLATDEVYAHLTTAGETIKAGVTESLTAAGVPHVVQSNGTMFSVFFTGEPVRDFDDASTQDVAAYAAFFHAMLDAGVHLPPSAYEAWFLSAAHDDRAVQTVLDALPSGRAGRGQRRRQMTHPTKSLRWRSTIARGPDDPGDDRPPAAARGGPQPERRAVRPEPGLHLSDLGGRWPSRSRARSRTATSPISVASPLERAQETARPLADARGLEIVTDERVIESTNVFEGQRFGKTVRPLRRPAAWRHLWNPFRPSWGEPYKELVARMMARSRTRGTQLAATRP